MRPTQTQRLSKAEPGGSGLSNAVVWTSVKVFVLACDLYNTIAKSSINRQLPLCFLCHQRFTFMIHAVAMLSAFPSASSSLLRKLSHAVANDPATRIRLTLTITNLPSCKVPWIRLLPLAYSSLLKASTCAEVHDRMTLFGASVARYFLLKSTSAASVAAFGMKNAGLESSLSGCSACWLYVS